MPYSGCSVFSFARRRRDYLSRRRQIFKFIVTTLAFDGKYGKVSETHTCPVFCPHFLMFVWVRVKSSKTKNRRIFEWFPSGQSALCVSFGERAPATFVHFILFPGERFPQWSATLPLGHRGRTHQESARMALCGNLKNRQSAQGVTSLLLLTSVRSRPRSYYIFGIRRTRSKIVTHHLHLFFMLRLTHFASTVQA